jgi:magnesium-transporting ATPase (P-type)
LRQRQQKNKDRKKRAVSDLMEIALLKMMEKGGFTIEKEKDHTYGIDA